jgi:hypothetical protein
MEKYKLKINYHNEYGNFTKGTILTKTFNYYYNEDNKLKLHQDFVENNSDIFEEVKPKFKVGDWVIGWHCKFKEYDSKAWQINYVDNCYVSPNSLFEYATPINNIRLATQEEIDTAKPKSKWLADEFQVMEIIPANHCYKNLLNGTYKPTDPKGKIFDNEKDALLYHAKLKYPIGTKFRVFGLNHIAIVEFYKQYDNCNIITANSHGYAILSNGNEWAEIVKEDKTCSTCNYSINYGVTCNHPNLFKEVFKNNHVCIDNNYKYWKVKQDKQVVEVEIPINAYHVECPNCNEKFDVILPEGTFIKQPTKSCKTCLFELHDKFTGIKCGCCKYDTITNLSDNTDYDNYQSKQDLTNTKIFIGDNPKLSELVQKKAFELGWKGFYNKQIIFYRSNLWLFFDRKIISWEFTNNPSKNYTEIFPIDLGIKPEEYEVKLVTKEGVNKYRNDLYFFIENDKIYEARITGFKSAYKFNGLYFNTKQAAEKYLYDKAVEEAKKKYNQ